MASAISHTPSERIDVRVSGALSETEKKVYLAMLNCRDRWNDQELFKAALYCFDMSFGPGKTNNIITIRDYLAVMGEVSAGKTLEENSIAPEFFAHDRPGFFLLREGGEVLFLKEGESGSLVHYEPENDAFVDSASLEVTGSEKLVVLNKTTFPKPDTYFGEHTPDGPKEGKFYHEKQQDRKCAIHATHAFVGFPFIHETSFSLTQLEALTDHIFPSEIPNLDVRKHHLAKFMYPVGQVEHYKEISRFKLAQTSLFQADLGGGSNNIVFTLREMAATGAIAEKYRNAKTFSMRMGHLTINYAIEKGLHLEDREWTLDTTRRVLQAVSLDLAQERNLVEFLDRSIDTLMNQGADHRLHPRHAQYRTLTHERNPYTMLEIRKDDLEKTVRAMAELETLFQRSDRVIVLLTNEDHCYTFRKGEDEKWILIDGENPTQIQVEDPLQWLKNRQQVHLGTNHNFTCEFITIA